MSSVKGLRDLVWDVYEESLRRHFSNHPNGNNIVNAMKAGQLTTKEIDRAFNEAECFSWAVVMCPEKTFSFALG